jgi:lysophospholipase L1-like esterase
VALGETLTWLLAPQAIRVPRSVWSQRYGLATLPGTRTVDVRRGVYRFEYTSNAQGFRGELVPPSLRDGRAHVVLLGDSYTFGYGVNDADVFGTLLAQELRATHVVANLGSPGFGLGQEIRLFHDLGAQHEPSVVVLQWCENDLGDDVRYPVTEIVDGRFEFRDVARRSAVDWAKSLLSRSALQRSQLYALLRSRLYDVVTGRQVSEAERAAGQGAAALERRYAEKLALFAQQLAERGAALLFLPVHGELARHPELEASVGELERRGWLRRMPTEAWLDGLGDVGSPEGHAWGATAHRAIARELAEAIRDVATMPARDASVSAAIRRREG